MNIKIYQINTDRDKNRVKFEGLSENKEIDFSIYDRVFMGDVDCKNLEDVYTMFNTTGHRLHRGHSLSVSDIVEVDGKFHFCDTFGFESVDFNPAEAHAPLNLMRVLVLEPKRPPYVSEIENTLEGQQKAVGGYIQYVYNDGDGTITVCDEEGKLKGLEGCRRIEGDILVGNCFIAGDGGEELCSLTDEQIEKYTQRYAEPEDISHDEVVGSMGYTIVGI